MALSKNHFILRKFKARDKSPVKWLDLPAWTPVLGKEGQTPRKLGPARKKAPGKKNVPVKFYIAHTEGQQTYLDLGVTNAGTLVTFLGREGQISTVRTGENNYDITFFLGGEEKVLSLKSARKGRLDYNFEMDIPEDIWLSEILRDDLDGYEIRESWVCEPVGLRKGYVESSS